MFVFADIHRHIEKKDAQSSIGLNVSRPLVSYKFSNSPTHVYQIVEIIVRRQVYLIAFIYAITGLCNVKFHLL